MKKLHYLDTIISPNITEKSTSLSEHNKIVFKVNKGEEVSDPEVDLPTELHFDEYGNNLRNGT